MAHPLYYRARQWVGRPVYVHQVNGRVSYGTLVSAYPHGIYVIKHPAGTVLTAATLQETEVDHAVSPDMDLALDLVYAPVAYFGFGALTGLALGAAARGYWW